MLAVVRVLPPQKGFFANRRASMGRIPLEIRHKNLLGADILEIFAVTGKKGINYKSLGEKLRPLYGKTVLQESLKNHEEFGITQYDDFSFSQRMLLNFAVDVISRAARQTRVPVVLYDKRGECPPSAAELVRAGASVTVFTENPLAFKEIADYCFESFGAGIKLNTPSADGCFAAGVSLYEGAGAPIFGGVMFSAEAAPGALFFDKRCILFPDELEDFCCADMPDADFVPARPLENEYTPISCLPSVTLAAALCEECGFYSLLSMVPVFLVRDGELCSKEDVTDGIIKAAEDILQCKKQL